MVDPTILWRVIGVGCTPQVGDLQDVVHWVQWQCYGTQYAPDGRPLAAAVQGEVNLALDPNAEFIARTDITEKLVLEWVFGSGTDKQAVETDVINQLEAQIGQA